MDDVFVPTKNLLPNVRGQKGPGELPEFGTLWHRPGVLSGAGNAYERTHDVHVLILGPPQTALRAFC